MADVLHLALRDLVADARLMLDHQRSRSCVLLSTIAFELAGKILILRWGKKGSNHHLTKQRVAASLMMSMLFMDGIEAAGLQVIRRDDLPDAQATFLRQVESSEESAAAWRSHVLDAMAKGVDDWPHNRILGAIQNGWLHRAKNDVEYGVDELKASIEEFAEAAVAMVAMCERLVVYFECEAT